MSQKIFQKFDALQQLSTLGVDLPVSFVVDRNNYLDILRSLTYNSRINYWVVRVPLEQKHLIKRPAYATAEMNYLFTNIFSDQPNCNLLITELIPAIRAGIIIKARDFFYCEYVPGALQSLARDGVTPIRVLLKSDGQVGFVDPNVPEFFYSWYGTDLKKVSTPYVESIRSIEDLLKNLLTFIRYCPQLSLIEWVQAPTQQLYAVDFKNSETGFLGKYEDIYHGLVNHCLISLPKPSEITAASIKSGLTGGALFIEYPLYSYILDGSAFSASRIVLRTGGLLAHLIVECSRRSIPCIISPILFAQKIGDRR